MELSDLTLRVLLLFFPGLICCKLVDSLIVHKDRDTATLVVHSFILGICCYLLLYSIAQFVMLGSSLVNRPIYFDIAFFDALTNTKAELRWLEILMAAGVAFPFAFMISWFATKKLVHRLAQRIGITNKFADLDVWDYMLNSKEVLWIVARDIKNDLMFYGWVLAFSDVGEMRELLLRDVHVYRNSTGELLYGVGGLYFSRKKDEITLELADLGYTTLTESTTENGA